MIQDWYNPYINKLNLTDQETCHYHEVIGRMYRTLLNLELR